MRSALGRSPWLPPRPGALASACLADALALLVLRRSSRAVVSWSAASWASSSTLARLLLVERRLRGIRGLLRRDHLGLGLLLQPVALGAGDDRLVAEALRGSRAP